MVNELPLNYFTFLTIIQIGLLIYCFLDFNKNLFLRGFGALLSAIIGYTNSNMILNGSVVLVQSDGTTYSYIPVQSLPVHYLLLGLTIVAGLLFIMFIIRILQHSFEKAGAFEPLGGWD